MVHSMDEVEDFMKLSSALLVSTDGWMEVEAF